MIAEHDQNDDVAQWNHALLALADRESPGHPLPDRLQALLPDPMRSMTDWQRFVHADIEDLDPARRKWELLRLRAAAAFLEYEQIPVWVHQRLARLAEAA